tara:strand:+ start:824 stop:1129 length:306 start_codon:yes stop_codon:yes gene_type:complete
MEYVVQMDKSVVVILVVMLVLAVVINAVTERTLKEIQTNNAVLTKVIVVLQNKIVVEMTSAVKMVTNVVVCLAENIIVVYQTNSVVMEFVVTETILNVATI